MKKIVIIGSGFASLTAIRTIRKHNKKIKIIAISPKAEFIFLPSLIWVPGNKVKDKDIVIPLANFFRKFNVEHIAAKVTGLSSDNRTIYTDKLEIKNDYLIIASGGRFIKKIPGIENTITPCQSLRSVKEIRDKLKSMQGGTIAIGFSGNPNEGPAMRGGPMFEFLFGIEKQLRVEKRRNNFEIIFFTPAPKPGARLGHKAADGILREMKKRNITTYLGQKIKKFTKDKISTEKANFKADLILFMPGMTGNKWFDNTSLPRSEGGFIKANKYCQVEECTNVFVAGDAGSFPGPDWLPKQGHIADLQAEAAAKNCLAIIDNKKPSHTFKAELICIIDSYNKGILVKRSAKSNLILPNSFIFHFAKKVFAWWYLRKYR